MNSIEHENIHDSNQENYIPVKTRKETTRVNTREIFYIESELRIVNVYTAGRTYRFYGKLDEIGKYLNSGFYRCHKSCIINLEKIERMENGIFYFSDGRTIRIGQNNYRHTRSYYVKFLERNAGRKSGRSGSSCGIG